MGIGELAALAAALMWTLSSMIWGRINLSALTINFYKNWIGVVLTLIHLGIVSLVVGDKMFQAPAASWFWLGMSGVVGIVVGDTLYFRSLQILGPRRALMVSTTAPLFSALMVSFVLKESLRTTTVLGIVMTVLGVVVVVFDRKSKKEAPGLMPGSAKQGAIAGVLGAVCQAVGGVMSQRGMNDASGNDLCSAGEATFIRILVSAMGTFAVVLMAGQLKKALRDGLKLSMLKLLIPATAVGTWIGIWLSQVAYKHTNAAIAQTLLATCPLFAIPIVWYFYRQKVTLLGIIGTVVALAGVFFAVYEF